MCPSHALGSSVSTTGGRRAPIALGLTVAFAALATGFGASNAHAQSLEGSWRGAGTVSFASGNKERVSCRATYSRIGGSSYSMNATCAAPSGSVTQSATVQKVGDNRYSGDIYNVQYNSYGSISVTVSGSSQKVVVRGEAGSGTFSLSRN